MSEDETRETGALPPDATGGAGRRPLVVAVDGPAGSGKSSVSRAAARRLGFAYLDTGAAYRSLAWHVLETGRDPEDGRAVTASLADFDYRAGTDPEAPAVAVGDVDVTRAIREPRVSAAVSGVARVPAVRTRLTELFRERLAGTERPGIIAEGRDITTVVAPDATVRVLLTADPAVRAGRRRAELSGGEAADAARAMTERDARDSRVVDFLTAAEGVTTLDSTDLDLEATVAALVDLVRAAG